MIRWILAFLGFVIFRFPGGVIGYLIGYYLDQMQITTTRSGSGIGTQRGSVSPADFELNLLSLASLVIKADGTVSQKELDYVRMYFVQAYGKDRANATFRTFNEVIKKREVNAQNICNYLRQRTRYEARLQIIHFLFSVADADGYVSPLEVDKIRSIANYLSIRLADFESIKAMFFKSADSAYTILEIEKSATDNEVKAAYRSMVKKYHPDKLQHMDEAHQKGAEAKFRKVQEAYEQIQKERGM